MRYKGIEMIRVMTADEMYDAAVKAFGEADIAVMAAAVADYTPEVVAAEKIKKSDAHFQLLLKKTKDILKHMGEVKKPHQLVVGFALETENAKENALKKLHDKKADLIVMNTLKDEGAGFGKDTNKVTVFDGTTEKAFATKSKRAVAKDIVDLIVQKQHEKD